VGNVTLSFPQMSTNYNALQITANRRLGAGLQFGVSYTFSKALGATATNPYFNTHYWSYGPLGQDRSQNFVVNYIYDVPQLGKRINSKLLGVATDNWQISGITFATTKAHLVRAALEAQAHQVHDLMTAYAADGVRWERLKIDGGMVCNDWLAQDLADMLDLTVERPAFIETTALGAAMLAAVGSGIYPDLAAAAAAMRGAVTHFEPAMDDAERDRRLAGWKEALGKI